jgi:hypothetical protein
MDLGFISLLLKKPNPTGQTLRTANQTGLNERKLELFVKIIGEGLKNLKKTAFVKIPFLLKTTVFCWKWGKPL